jgi:hypothetical protein
VVRLLDVSLQIDVIWAANSRKNQGHPKISQWQEVLQIYFHL